MKILPKLHLTTIRNIFIFSVILVGVYSGGYLTGLKGYNASLGKTIGEVKIERGTSPQEVDFNLFWKVWDIMKASYFDKTKLVAGDMVYGAIQGMVAAVGDPYTVFLPPKENKVIEEDLKGSFQGVGIQIGFKGTQLAVIAPLPGTPAEKAGIKAGDYIVAIKDESKKIDRGTAGITLPDAVQAIRGPRGSKVTLALTRDGLDKPIVVEVIREEIQVASVTIAYVGDKKEIAHLRLTKFGGETNGEWQKSVTDILRNNPKGVILDLRSNPGGYLQGAVDIAGDFLKTGSVVVIEEKNNQVKSEYKTSGLPRLSKYPVVVLIDKGSASASEILAGALREQAGYKLIGDVSFGKGTIQEPKQLEAGAGLHVTIARWLTPKGYWVHEKGLEPDIVIADDAETQEDEQLLKAIATLGQ